MRLGRTGGGKATIIMPHNRRESHKKGPSWEHGRSRPAASLSPIRNTGEVKGNLKRSKTGVEASSRSVYRSEEKAYANSRKRVEERKSRGSAPAERSREFS